MRNRHRFVTFHPSSDLNFLSVVTHGTVTTVLHAAHVPFTRIGMTMHDEYVPPMHDEYVLP